MPPLRLRVAMLGAWMCAVAAGPARSQALSTRLVAEGFEHPSHIAFAPGDRSRMFVVEFRARRIRVVRNGTLLATPFLDLGATVSDERETGLNSVAFHPDYGRNGRFYVNDTDDTRTTYVREFTVGPDPDVADPTTGVTIFGPLAQPFGDHNGGGLAFGPDGMLWLALGDGGGISDPDNRAQDLTTVLGKLLRLDVDNPPSYVPPDNPYAGPANDPQGTIPDEIWARGLRNPWRYSFDRLSGELYIADVGLDAWEEISVQPAESTGGENYGWRCLEGAECTGLSGCACTDPLLSAPIHAYDHAQGCAIVGGFVYRGGFLDGLQGTYFFADYCRGRVWSLRYSGGAVTELVERTAELAPPGESSLGRVSSFGEDVDGELYIADILRGRVFRIETACPPRESYCRTAPNGYGAGAWMGSLGTNSVFLDDLVLSTAGLPPGSTGVYFRGRTRTQIPFGHGFLCIEAPVVRFGAVLSTGQASHPFRNQHVPAVRPGETWLFQILYRNGELGPPAFNLSDGLSVPFCP